MNTNYPIVSYDRMIQLRKRWKSLQIKNRKVRFDYDCGMLTNTRGSEAKLMQANMLLCRAQSEYFAADINGSILKIVNSY